MSELEPLVTTHYTHGSLERVLADRLDAFGAISEAELVDRLAAVDEFHLGGRDITAAIAARLGVSAGARVLDIGCGLAGTARFLASRCGYTVTGIDLTPEFVAVGRMLNERVGLDQKIKLHVGSATALPFRDGSFDAATLFHVAMNIPDKKLLFREAARVLIASGTFAVYDVMRTGSAPLTYPLPWASTPEASFVAAPDVYRSALDAAGFTIVSERNRRDDSLAFFRAIQTRRDAGPPSLGLHILMREEAPGKVRNTIEALESDAIAPIEMIARRR